MIQTIEESISFSVCYQTYDTIQKSIQYAQNIYNVLKLLMKNKYQNT